ncbi:MAG: hypothetical protein MZV65_40770 [Chromatiales bacterium]|nr:hypothetical protein [Chromatiales bacterium]
MNSWQNILAMGEGLDESGAGSGLLVAAIATPVLVAVLAAWLLRTEYAGAVRRSRPAATRQRSSRSLKHRKVPYRLEEGGTRILVPERQVHENRLALMSKGALLDGAVGSRSSITRTSA